MTMVTRVVINQNTSMTMDAKMVMNPNTSKIMDTSTSRSTT